MKNTRRNKIMSAAIWLIVLASGTGLFVSAQTPTPQVNEIRELTAGQTLEREIKGGETHGYKINLKTGEFFRVLVEQRGADVVVRLFTTDGKLLAERDHPNGKNGEESLSAEVVIAGEYQIEVAALEKDAPVGRYKITSDAPRQPTSADKSRIIAETAFQEAMILRETKTAESWRKALVQYETALSAWESLADDYATTMTLLTMALTESALGNFEVANQRLVLALQKAEALKNELLVGQIKTGLAKNYYDAGVKFLQQGTLESKRTAAEKFKLASDLYQETENKQGESLSLIALGRIAYETSEKALALKYFEKAAILCRAIGDKLGEGIALGTIGVIYSEIGDKQQALKFYSESLPLFQAVGDKKRENTTLNNIAKAYSDLGDKKQALKFYSDALLFARAIGDKLGEARTLNNIGESYNSIGEAQKALEFFQLALQIFRKVQDKDGESKVFGNIAYVYSELGEKQKALDFYTLALQIARQLGNTSYEGAILSSFGAIHGELGETQKALEFFNQALPLLQNSGNKRGESKTLSNIGGIYRDLGEIKKAIDYINKGLSLIRTIGNKRDEGIQLTELGGMYFGLGENQKALEYFQQGLLLNKEVGDRRSEALTLVRLQVYWNKLKNQKLAIAYGKQSVNLYQELRRNIQGLDKQTQKTYLKSIEGIYRYLTNILIAEGRVAEAEQVLGMLKEEEFFEYLRRDDKAAKELKATIKLTPTEAEAFKRYEEIADDITRIGREFGELEKESKKFPVGKFPRQAEMDKLDKQLADARKVFNKFLEDLDARFRNKETKEKDSRVAQISGTKALLDSLNQPRTVIISTIAGEDRLNLIVTTSKINRAHTVDIKAADLNKLVVEFRDEVKNPSVDPRPLGKKLYDILFPADLQKDLAGVDADTIVWSLDGTLRYAPMSALWDGQKYLVEQYSHAILTLASRDKIDKTQAARTNWTALGLGVSQAFENFDALDAVPQELCRVVNDESKKAACLKLTNGKTGVFGGINLSDSEFTFENFKLHLGRYPIVHIASHFSLNAGTENDSYLLLGGGKTSEERKLSISAVREKLDTKFVGTELLVLSACNTAMSAGENSSGAEIEGFGALAQEQGAKTVLASLWSVADDSTRDLMTEFYDQLKRNPKIGKAESLRKSQIALLNGKYKPGETPQWRGTAVFNLGETKQPAFKTDENAPFAHPFYWSPFILFGNWK